MLNKNQFIINCMKRVEQMDRGQLEIKQWEIAIQDEIESLFPDKCWWRITSVNIFLLLMETQNVNVVIDAVWKDIIEYNNK